LTTTMMAVKTTKTTMTTMTASKTSLKFEPLELSN
jgi:hypothetical protein